MAQSQHSSGIRRVGDLEIEQDLVFERRQNVVQRVGWGIGVLILLAAMLGGFGDGPLASATLRSPDGLITLRYQRLARDRAPDRLRIEIASAAIRDTEITIGLSQDYFEDVRIQTITPAPLAAEPASGEIRYRFAASDAPVVIHVDLEHDGPGSTAGTIRAHHPDGRHSSITFSQFVFP